MKPLYLFIISIVFLTACDEGSGKKTTYKPESVGNINHLQVVVSNELWEGPVGESIREYFAAPTDGLPQDEPLFSMNQMDPSVFTGFARNNRIFLLVQKGDKNAVKIAKNEYARPQTGVIITGETEEDIVELIEMKQEKMIESLKMSEIKERQKRTKISAMKLDSLRDYFGVRLSVPSAYKVAHSGEDFYWLRKRLESGTTNVLVYEVPLNTIGKDSAVIGDIIRVRDSIGGGLLPVEDDGRFITEAAYAPYLFTTTIDDKFAYETKGTWEVKGQWMAGPFVNYAVRDEKNDRYLILEGFTYAPSVEKRDLQFELESILKSAQID